MNLLTKTRNFLWLYRNGVSLKGSLYSFKGKLTDGDKYALTMILCVLAICVVLMNVQAIDCGVGK